MALSVAVLMAFLLLPMWLVLQPNPEWRMASWAFAFLVVALLLSICALAGGRRWVAHFAFPVSFIFTAIPWPSAIENPVVQGLTAHVTSLAVEILNLTGTIAVQRGNLIEVGTGVLGVNEACSGIRSLQAAIMVALFLGEMLRLRTLPRLLLLVASVVTAFFGNIVRATLLASTAARSGMHSVDEVHDAAGYSILTACLIVTWLLGLKLAPRSEPTLASGEKYDPHALSVTFCGSLAAWMIFGFFATEWWFGRAHSDTGMRLVLTPPAHGIAVSEIPIPPVVTQVLRFDEHRAVTWREATGQTWMAYCFRWGAGPARSRILARIHRPDFCLTAVGHALTADRGEAYFDIDGVSLPLQRFTFGEGTASIQVYYGVWENRASAFVPAPLGESAMRGSLRAVQQRERHLSQHVVELALFGYPSADEADASVRRRLPGIFHLQSSKSD